MNVHAAAEKQRSFAPPSHPLDPLSAAELGRAAEIIRHHYDCGEDLRVETIDVEEPAKDIVRAYEAGAPFERIARYAAFKRGKLGVWIGRIDLGADRIVEERFDENARAMVAIEEVLEIEATVKADSALSGGVAPPRPPR